jgi:hypothetical protein
MENLSAIRKRKLHDEVAVLLTKLENEGSEYTTQILTARHLLQSNHPEKAEPYLLASLRSLYSIHANQLGVDILELAQPLLTKKTLLAKLREVRSLAAGFYARVGKHVESLELLNQLLEYSNGDRPVLLRRIADLQLKRRNLSAAMQVVKDTDPFLKILPEPKRSQEKGRLLSIEQIVSLLQGDFDRVHELAKQMAKIKPSIPVREGA